VPERQPTTSRGPVPPAAGRRTGHQTGRPAAPARAVELLAPGGDREAACAALHYGADAIYCGLQKFSARAEAVNFSPDQLAELAAYAHALTPRRRVLVTVNTVVLDRERAELAAALDAVDQAGADAVIVQDLGVARICRRWFPRLALHASTQLAVHNLAGVETLRQLGFRRVTLARELTLEEIRLLTAQAGVETEVFIHGALCYAYSGLCLFSSLLRGRSGNRGRCAYPCRDFFRRAGPADATPGPAGGYVFSMKDLALPDDLAALRAAGVASFKIEGRKKNALYVAATVDFYRRLLDGRLPAAERPAAVADLQTIFSRPWTRLYLAAAGHDQVVDRDVVGHRGTLIGAVETVVPYGRGAARLRFHTRRALERHDGLQLDLPGAGQPFGFPVDALRVVGSGQGARTVCAAPAGSLVEVELPRERPHLPAGAPIYCSSSQAVKRGFPFPKPKAGAYRLRRPLAVTLTVTPERLEAAGRLAAPDDGVDAPPVAVTQPGPFQPAKDAAGQYAAARHAFDKLGATPYRLAGFELHNPAGCFVPVSVLNDVRRRLCAGLVAVRHQAAAAQLVRLQAAVEADAPPAAPAPAAPDLQWHLRVDHPAVLDAFEDGDWQDVEEVHVAVELAPLPALLAGLERLAGRIGHEHLRLALPVITRRWEEADLLRRLGALRAAGWRRFAAANVSAWGFLRLPVNGAAKPAAAPDPELIADWPLYALNASAAAQLMAMGAGRVTLSPEDGFDNIRDLLRRCGEHAVVIVYQDTPLFISESCPAANLAGRCPGSNHCTVMRLDLDSGAGERLAALNARCRTVTISRQPFCVSHRLAALRQAGARRLRVDFGLRAYTADEARRVWRDVRAGRAVPGTHPGNFDRGLL